MFQLNASSVIQWIIFIAVVYAAQAEPMKKETLPFLRNTYDSNETMHWRWQNQSIKFWCRCADSPYISVEWMKDGLPIAPDSNKNIINQWSLKVLNLSKSDSGIYACNVSNQYGHLVRTFMLVIFEKILLQNIIVEDLSPKYIDVRKGGTGLFMCQIRSVVPFLLRWYRMDKPILQPKSLIELKAKKTLLKVIYVDKFKQLSVSGWIYRNYPNFNDTHTGYTVNDILMLPNVSLPNEAEYVCEAFRPSVVSNKTADLVIYDGLHTSSQRTMSNDIFNTPFGLRTYIKNFVYVIMILAGFLIIAGILTVIKNIYSGCTSTQIYFLQC